MNYSNDEVNNFRQSLFRDGFLKIDNLINGHELEAFSRVCNSVRDKPSPFKLLKKTNDGEFFMDYNNWRKNKEIFRLCSLPHVISLIKTITQSEKCWLMHEDIIIKSGASNETPIHHDRPYFIFKGELNLSLWLALSDVPRNSSLICFKGSHKIKELVLPKDFASGKNAAGFVGLNKEGFTELNESILERYEKKDFEVNAGDGILFFNTTLHASKKHRSSEPRKNFIIRYLLDGASLTKVYYNNVPPYSRMGVDVSENAPVPEDFFPEVSP